MNMRNEQIINNNPDLNSVKTFIQDHAPENLEIENFKLIRKVSNPSKGTRFLFKAESKEPDGTNETELYFSARSMHPLKGMKCEEEINSKFSEIYPGTIFQGFKRASIYSSDLTLLIQIFPADKNLPYLVNATDPNFMISVFNQILCNNRKDMTLTNVNAFLVQYKPGRKCLIKYHLDWSNLSSKISHRQVIYGKVYRKVQRVFNNLSKIFTAWNSTTFQIPKPIGIYPDLYIGFLSNVPGKRLSMMSANKNFVRICRVVARGLTEFQDTPVVLNEKRDLALELSELNSWGSEFANTLPEHSTHIMDLVRGISDALTHQNEPSPKLVHGDFHLANIQVDGDRLGLLDFENCFMGNPAVDVGSFYAQLKLLSLKANKDHKALDLGVEGFLNEYMGNCSAEYRYHIAVYCALSCLWCAYFQCILKPAKFGWRDRALAMLQVCEDVLKKGL